jgi:hypothetical protein
MSESGDVISFDEMPQKRDDFLRWRRRNREGFVLNEKRMTDFMLHRASCDALEAHTEQALGNPKHCSTDRRALLKFAEDRSALPSRCQICVP